MKYILVAVYAFIACLALLIIMRIRARKHVADAAAGESESPDFIDDISNYRRRHLTVQPWNMKYETYSAISTACTVLFAVVGYLASGVVYAICGAIIGFWVPELVVRVQSASQKQKFEERYARSLRQLSAALKSGMSLHQAIEDVCHSPFVHDDVRVEFQRLSADLKLSIPIHDAFNKFADRVGFDDARDVAIAIGMQAKVGGREGAVIETIARNISERMMLRKEINSMFSGSSVTITVLDVLPFAVVIALAFGAQEFSKVYFESFGMTVLFFALIAFMVVGTFVTRHMVSKMKKECGVGK